MLTIGVEVTGTEESLTLLQSLADDLLSLFEPFDDEWEWWRNLCLASFTFLRNTSRGMIGVVGRLEGRQYLE